MRTKSPNLGIPRVLDLKLAKILCGFCTQRNLLAGAALQWAVCLTSAFSSASTPSHPCPFCLCLLARCLALHRLPAPVSALTDFKGTVLRVYCDCCDRKTSNRIVLQLDWSWTKVVKKAAGPGSGNRVERVQRARTSLAG